MILLFFFFFRGLPEGYFRQPSHWFLQRRQKAEKENLLKTSLQTDAAVRTSKLQLQNVQHVLKVFDDKVDAALKLQKCGDTADFIRFVLN